MTPDLRGVPRFAHLHLVEEYAPPREDDEGASAPAPSSRAEPDPSESPRPWLAPAWLAGWSLVIIIVSLVSLSGCRPGATGGAETVPAPPSGTVSAAAVCIGLAPYLTLCCDEEKGICCYRTLTRYDSIVPSGVALSCVRVLPMQWQIPSRPEGRASFVLACEEGARARGARRASSRRIHDEPGAVAEDAARAGLSLATNGKIR